MVTGLDAIKPARLIGNHAGKDIEPPGGAFRIGGRRDVGRQCQAFHQRHDVDAPGFQHGAVAQTNLMQLEFRNPLFDRCAGARQEARANPVRHRSEAQIEARRLDLPRHEGLR